MATSYQRRRQRVRDLRLGIQLLSLGVVAAIGIRFTLWVRGLEQGRLIGERPPGVEGFLPISALMSLRAWILSGTPSRVHAAGLVLLVLILAMSFLLRKAFCAWICPVGTLAEWLGNLGLRLARRRARLPRRLDVPLRGVKYLLAAFFVYAVFIGHGAGAAVPVPRLPLQQGRRREDAALLHASRAVDRIGAGRPRRPLRRGAVLLVPVPLSVRRAARRSLLALAVEGDARVARLHRLRPLHARLSRPAPGGDERADRFARMHRLPRLRGGLPGARRARSGDAASVASPRAPGGLRRAGGGPVLSAASGRRSWPGSGGRRCRRRRCSGACRNSTIPGTIIFVAGSRPTAPRD